MIAQDGQEQTKLDEALRVASTSRRPIELGFLSAGASRLVHAIISLRDAHHLEISLHDAAPVGCPRDAESQPARLDALGITQASPDNSCKLMHAERATPIDTLKRSLGEGCLRLRSEIAIQMECLQMECPAGMDMGERSLSDRFLGFEGAIMSSQSNRGENCTKVQL